MKKLHIGGENARMFKETEAMVSDCDFDACTQKLWTTVGGHPLRPKRSIAYNPGAGCKIYLTRFVGKRMGLDMALEIVCIDGNYLNCQRDNLRNTERKVRASKNGGWL
jgi:hypothetical protein